MYNDELLAAVVVEIRVAGLWVRSIILCLEVFCCALASRNNVHSPRKAAKSHSLQEQMKRPDLAIVGNC